MIITEISGRPALYRLKHFQLDKSVTKKGTGLKRKLHPEFEKLLRDCKNQPPAMHDIQLSFQTSGLYESLLKQPDLKTTKKNKQFNITIPVNPRFEAKTIISRSGRVDLYIGCSQKPILIHPDSFAELTFFCGQMIQYLTIRANSEFIYQPVKEWIFERYHLNRDSEPIINPIWRYSIGALEQYSYFYIKEFEDGSIRARAENKLTPKTKHFQEYEKSVNFVRASEMLKN
ncbi:MAG: hypothetical protein GWN01_16020 [Nitrosopumilaceae archaeon]|nr:hypothetical protein [Nitrosopumilaceae archaeon]NIU02344.1 hypothetical protein [Nitrosopumilaceae archaeon]NIU88800.1 hypothetical protein [Nitrosopumilaceae archaeon]NIV66926.1 hypothetical protein [Nitrosopumilaceae archaeon]NIX62945.1 hypothetical protein [Nitrosopumilaceae archaeon]